QYHAKVAARIVTTTAAPISNATGEGARSNRFDLSMARSSRWPAATVSRIAISTIAKPVVLHSTTAACHHGTARPPEIKLATGTSPIAASSAANTRSGVAL